MEFVGFLLRFFAVLRTAFLKALFVACPEPAEPAFFFACRLPSEATPEFFEALVEQVAWLHVDERKIIALAQLGNEKARDPPAGSGDDDFSFFRHGKSE